MRISDKNSLGKIDKDSKSSSLPKSSSAEKNIFYTEILQQESEIKNYQYEIENLHKEVNTAGERLEKEPTIPNFKQFRELLSKIAKRINSEAYRLEKCGGTPQNPRYFEIITTINIEADKLYNLIVQSQKNNMAITAKVIGIKGLVIDLIT
jgi:uncharacterized protein YaaR (DUF327 family)